MILKHDNSLLTEGEINKSLKNLENYLSFLRGVKKNGGYELPESSINLPFDEETKAKVLKLAGEKRNKNLKYILLLGIGGSNLGAKAVYDALRGYFEPVSPDVYPKMIFLDATDAGFLKAVRKFLEDSVKSPEEIVINVVSKSGETTETIFNLEGVAEILSKKLGNENFLKRLVVTTQSGSGLHKKATSLGISALDLPEKVPGRFSVFSPAGLFPLALLGFNIEDLLSGARNMVENCLINSGRNAAAINSVFLSQHYRQGKRISDLFLFNPALESLGKWWRQLVAESTGEEKKTWLGRRRVGVTPTVSIGSTDLHSMGQLYLSGPKDRTTAFVFAGEENGDFEWLKENIFSDREHLLPKNPAVLTEAILSGTKEAYRKKKLPFLEIDLGAVSEKSIGEFMQFQMISIMLLGRLLKINPFDQPNVEAYKQETRCVLQKQK